MKSSFILMMCLLSTILLQADYLTCDCKKKKKHIIQKPFKPHIHLAGCGCGGNGNGGSNELPPDES